MLGNVLNSEKQAKLRSGTMLLNGKELFLGENDMLPELVGMKTSGLVEIAPGGCTFFFFITKHFSFINLIATAALQRWLSMWCAR